MIKNIRHSGIVVRDIIESYNFYVDLGFLIESDEIEKGKFLDTILGIDDCKIRVIKMSCDNQMIELLDYENPKSKDFEKEEQRTAYTLLHRLVFNLKRIMQKIPFVRSQLGTYATALFLLKEKYNIENLPEGEINKFLMENKMVSFDNNISEEVVGFGNMLPMGEYKLKDLVTADDEEIDAQKGDIVTALEDTPPSDRVLGVDIFPVIHQKSNKKIYISLEDIDD